MLSARTAGNTASWPARPAARAPGRVTRSLVDDLQQHLRGARVVRLAQPEDRFLAELLVLLALRDLDQPVDRGRLVALRVHEDELLLHLPVLHAVVQTRELRQVPSGLAGPEERLLAHLDLLPLVQGDVDEPGSVVRLVHLRAA